MKKMLVAALSLAAAALAGMSATAAAQPPGGDSVAGSATSECFFVVDLPPFPSFCALSYILNIDAHSGPAGQNPTGTVTVDEHGNTPSSASLTNAVVTCLSVSGRVAIIGITGTRVGNGGFILPTAGLVRVVDAGGPDSGADTFQFALEKSSPVPPPPPLPGPTSCPTFPDAFPKSGFPDFTNATGNVVVTDTRPLPTSKDECKNGGWKTYGIFKNQGDCVSFVATGGKNPPANSP